MSPEDQRRVIAKACGHFWHPESEHAVFRTHHGEIAGLPYLVHYCECGAYRYAQHPDWTPSEDEAPDYPFDLNAMSVAENILTKEQQSIYIGNLENVVSRVPDANLWSWALAHAHAPQRAEAFIKTLHLKLE